MFRVSRKNVQCAAKVYVFHAQKAFPLQKKMTLLEFTSKNQLL